jgi:hypothetical protein
LHPAQFCSCEGVSLPSFYSWRRRLTAAATAASGTDDLGPPLLPVRLQILPASLELALPGGAVLRIPPGIDEATVQSLLCLLGVLPC